MKALVILTVTLVTLAILSLIFFFTREIDFADASAPQEIIEIEIGRVHSTWWFNFTIHSAERIDEFEGRTAAPGRQLWKVVVTQTGTFFDPIMMGTFDWFMDGDYFRADVFPHGAFVGRDDMMPEYFWLERGQSETHIMLFEVPADAVNLTLNYIEFGEFETGARFSLPLQ